MATYSLAVLGAGANPYGGAQSKVNTLPDDSALAGGQAQAMRNGTALLCKGPDGGLRWYQLDAERSTPTIPVLKRL